MALQGDTVRLVVHFKAFENVSINPNTISLTIYDKTHSELKNVSEEDITKEANGKYYYDYEISDDVEDYFIYEYGGKHNDMPILNRGKVKVKFNN